MRFPAVQTLAILAVLLLPVSGYAQEKEDDEAIHDAVQAKVRELFAGTDLPGISVGYCLPDGDSGAAVAGFADVEAKTPMTPDDRLLAGSIGKTFVSAALLTLVNEGKLGLDDKVSRYLADEPWFGRLPNASDITLRMLMNHSSGIPEHVESPEFTKALRDNPDKTWTPAELLSFSLDKKPVFPAGSGFSYADTNYIVAAMILEKVSERTMYQLVRYLFLGPLDLRDVGGSTARALPGLAVGYAGPNSPFLPEGRVINDHRFAINPQFEWAGGGFFTTPEALARWGHALYGPNLIKEPARAEWFKSIPANTGPDEKYGLGVQVRPSPLGTTYGHSGWFPGYLSDLEYFPDLKVSVAVQMNTDDLRKLKHSYRFFAIEIAKIIKEQLEESDANERADPTRSESVVTNP